MVLSYRYMDTSRDIELIKESTYRNSSKNHPLLNKLPPQIQYCAKAMQAPVDEIQWNSLLFYKFVTKMKFQQLKLSRSKNLLSTKGIWSNR